MPRKPRIHYPHAIYHVILRGNAKQNIFFDDTDRYHLCELLEEGVSRYRCQIHAFCFMSNHIHLAIQVADIPLSRFMQNISFRYASWINHRHNRVGHLFQARFKAILIDSDNYLKILVRYIHLNPVRAELIKSPDDFWWSSHSDYIKNSARPWVTTNFVLSQFHCLSNKATKLYRQFMLTEINKKNLPDLSTGNVDQRVFGDQNFLLSIAQQIAKPLPSKVTKEEVMKFVCKQYKLEHNEFFSLSRERKYSEPRAIFVWLCQELQIAPLTKITQVFHKDPASFIRKINKIPLSTKAAIWDDFCNKSISQA